MTSSNGWSLTPAEPPSRSLKPGGMYADIVNAFMASSEKASKLSLPGVKPRTAQVGLSKAIKAIGCKCRTSVRGDDIYLIRGLKA